MIASIVPPGRDLSVVVVVLEGGDLLRECLSHLERQRLKGNREVIVPYDQRLQHVSDFMREFPQVSFVGCEGRKTYAELRTVGIFHSRGRIVAVTEDQCRPQNDWCDQVMKGHDSHHAAVGGAVEKQVPDRMLGWAIYFADYVRYMTPMSPTLTGHLTDCNVSYKRSALDAIVSVWEKEFHEPEVHGALQAKGRTLWFDPEMVVYQRRSMGWSEALNDRWCFGRLFGSRRVVRASVVRRMAYGVAALATPLLTVLRVARNVFEKRRCVLRFTWALPALVVLNSTWALGECMGYWSGRPAATLLPDSVAVVGQEGQEEAPPR